MAVTRKKLFLTWFLFQVSITWRVSFWLLCLSCWLHVFYRCIILEINISSNRSRSQWRRYSLKFWHPWLECSACDVALTASPSNHPETGSRASAKPTPEPLEVIMTFFSAGGEVETALKQTDTCIYRQPMTAALISRLLSWAKWNQTINRLFWETQRCQHSIT